MPSAALVFLPTCDLEGWSGRWDRCLYSLGRGAVSRTVQWFTILGW